MREIRTSGSMSGDGKRDQYASGVESTRARPRLYPGVEAKCTRGPSVRGARRLAPHFLRKEAYLNSTVSTASKCNERNGGPIACFGRQLVRNAG